MKLIYIGKEELESNIRSLFKSRLVETIHYKNPLKAVDNLKEISPHIIYMVAQDFPRMWKIVLSESSNNYKDKISFILQGDLDEEDNKAFKFLGGKINIKNDDNKLARLKELINPTTAIKEIHITQGDELGIGFVNPVDFSFINGNVVEISQESLIIKSDNDLAPLIGRDISDASLSLGDIVATVNFKIESYENLGICSIISYDDSFKTLLDQLFV